MPVDDKNIIELEDRTMSRKQRRFTNKRENIGIGRNFMRRKMPNFFFKNIKRMKRTEG